MSSFANASLVLCYGLFKFVGRVAESWSALRTRNKAPGNEFEKFTCEKCSKNCSIFYNVKTKRALQDNILQ